MNMYVGMMAAVLVLAYVMRGDKPENKDYIWLSCLLMFALCGLRDVYSIGIDSATSYVSIFRRLGETDWADIPQGNNMGFTYLLKLCHTLTGGDYQSFYMLYTAFFMVIFGRFVSKYSPSPVQSFCYFWGLLCYIFLFDGIKQGIAMGFITLAFDAIVEKKPLWFALLVYIAWWFHAPALIFAPAYLIAMMKPGRMYLLFLAALLAFTYTFRDRILELMLEFYDTTIYDYEMRFLANKVIIMLGIVAAALVLRPPEEDDRVYGILLSSWASPSSSRPSPATTTPSSGWPTTISSSAWPSSPWSSRRIHAAAGFWTSRPRPWPSSWHPGPSVPSASGALPITSPPTPGSGCPTVFSLNKEDA